MKYTRTDMIKVLTAAGIERDKAREAALSIVNSLAGALAAGKTIELRGLGTFEQRQRNARERRNPRTGEIVHVSKSRAVVFKPAKNLKNIFYNECTGQKAAGGF